MYHLFDKKWKKVYFDTFNLNHVSWGVLITWHPGLVN